METKKQLPSMTQAEFDAAAAKLQRQIKKEDAGKKASHKSLAEKVEHNRERNRLIEALRQLRLNYFELVPPGERWTPVFSKWRHGGWYVHNVRYPSGAIGCVSNNYPDKKWRIACDRRLKELGAPGDFTFPSRDAAARAEHALVNSQASLGTESSASDEVTDVLDKAIALGFDSISAMRDHQAWLQKNGSPEYLQWATSVSQSGRANDQLATI